ncbi:hypothetical protein CGMCC3_g14433 [Colletotrichum fructicola]|uniref:Uncharacterized protein n=2 Tax=Colletotrichum fructicola (strain Nara gc5) TaxID=1213859 RepID=A0A7J6J468_COLFN|nr:uncharacterized protein CGMCC3_g14433 [Colletotrichum fructicola]KAE9569359.1 hypothetical protein CGMCC3_g14433 [Colletotrichum fructicola]KAF4484582.1 hypothetical protein CGGC5_v007047 [Colletotrichum fructicola Nara gc5]KAF4882946.1 hypothetical protein CGCFRS4_v014056 [Colletotrichum fructicola]
MAPRYNLRSRSIEETMMNETMMIETTNQGTVDGDATGYKRLILQICPKFLTTDEADEIRKEFNRAWIEDKQVFWSGADKHKTTIWAALNGFQTLTSAMGPLMEQGNDRCKRKTCSKSWSLYMRGASALFAWRVSQGRFTTVLTPPPPHRFHPSGLTNYQDVEEPILKGVLGSSVERIMMAHPEVAGAESFVYEAWPSDRYATWVASFGEFPDKAWRLVSRTRGILIILWYYDALPNVETARTIWQPIPAVPQLQAMLEDDYQGTIKQRQGQHQGQLQEQAQMKEKKSEVNQSPGSGLLAFMLFIEIFLHVVLPFIVFLETLTTQFTYECQNSEPQTEVKLGSSTSSKITKPHKSGLIRTDTSANQGLVANKVTDILSGDVPPHRLKKRQRQKLSLPQESTSQPIVTQKSTVVVCRSLGGWDPKSLKKAFRNRARRVTISSV